jgi:hypothetical protein
MLADTCSGLKNMLAVKNNHRYVIITGLRENWMLPSAFTSVLTQHVDILLATGLPSSINGFQFLLLITRSLSIALYSTVSCLWERR